MKKTTRREAIEKILKSGTALSFGGLLWGTGIKEAAEVDVVLRPPGALLEDEFVQACIRCGKCVEVCPYDTLKLATPGDGKVAGTPYFTPREIPCYLCTDIPCTTNCPSGALDLKTLVRENKKPSINNTKIGLAVIHKETCIAFGGIQCDACYRACPLIDDAITIKKEINTTTNKHANWIPVVNSNVCTGCGICEHVCVVEKAAIAILPRKLSTGKLSSHYIKSWEKSDEKRIETDPNLNEDKDDINSALDYLNDEDELY